MNDAQKTNLDDLITCSCGSVWELEIAKYDQHDWNKIRQECRCLCGTILYESKRSW